MNTLKLAEAKRFLLKEIEELGEINMPKPEDAYPFKSETKQGLGYGDYYLYTFENINGDLMEVTCLAEFPKEEDEVGYSLYVAFGIHEPEHDPEAPPLYSDDDEEYYDDEEEEEYDDEEEKYTKQTGANDMLKVMATVVEAIKRTFKKVGGVDNVKDIRFAPSDERRNNIYDHYIETLFGKESGDYHFKKDLNHSSQTFKVYKNLSFKEPK